MPHSISVSRGRQPPLWLTRAPWPISDLHAQLLIDDCRVQVWLRLQYFDWRTAMYVLAFSDLHLDKKHFKLSTCTIFGIRHLLCGDPSPTCWFSLMKRHLGNGRVWYKGTSSIPVWQFHHEVMIPGHRSDHKTPQGCQGGWVYMHIPKRPSDYTCVNQTVEY